MTTTLTPATAVVSPETHEAIARPMRDYALSWYSGDMARMEGALHPALAKRALLPTDGAESAHQLSEYTAEALVARVGRNAPEQFADAPKRCDVTILDVRAGVAAGRLEMDHWTDLMHLVRVDGAWRIMNILWEPN